MKEKTREAITGYLFITPIVLGYFAFMFAPIVSAIMKGFTNDTLFGESAFIGLDNYTKMLTQDKDFRNSLINTLFYTIGLVPLNIILAFLLAMLLKAKIKGIGFFRTAFFTPVVVSAIAWGVIWKFILGTQSGLINLLLRNIGIENPPAWLYTSGLTMVVVIVVTVLKGVGMNMVILLAAMHDVSEVYYEAATIEGASNWHKMRRITIPLISPTIFMLVMVTLIGSLKAFAQIYALTGGGPAGSTRVLAYYVYELAFRQFKFGYASAVAVVMFIIVLVFTLIQWSLRKRLVYNES